METNKEVGNKLKELRKKFRYTTREVGDRVGISHAYVSKIENGQMPKYSILERFCNLYEIEIQNLFGKTIDTPTELKELGIEWIAFAEEMKKENLTPDEIRKYIEVVKTLRGLE